ncbi:MAG: FAD-binding oxidoreductase [Pseudonocardia sp.]|nr:FAD-binding oxidoreductase [Pseudonocardia sp.]
MSTRVHDVVVIGAGIIGLTTAITLAEAGQRVLVRAAEPPKHTTSAAAGALWGPWMAEPAALVLKWAKHTLDVLTELATQPDTGVRLATGIAVSNIERVPSDWVQLLRDRRRCTPQDLPRGYRHGQRYTAPLVDMPRHLGYLTHRLHAAGAAIEISPVSSLDAIANLAPHIVNCTGLGARSLIADEHLYPIRGQHVVVNNPGLTDFLEVDTGDSLDLIGIYPHEDHVVLGGSAQPHIWDRRPNPIVTDGILDRCATIEPRLREAQVLDVRVGLRPARHSVRLDTEEGPAGTRLIHNYGHGGAGVSLCWGCAAVAAELSTQG